MDERVSFHSPASALAAAGEHFRAGRLAQAEGLYRRVLDNDPDHAAALHGLAIALARAGRPELAAAYLGRAAALAPEARYEFELGELWTLIGDHCVALACYRRAVAMDPGRPEPYAAAGALLSRMGRFEEAAEALRRAVDLGLDRAEVHHALCMALIRLSRHGEAEVAARNALRLTPESAEAWQTLGAVLGELWRLNEAIGGFRKAVSLKPDWALPHCALGVSLDRAGRPDEAADSLRAALKLDPDSAEANAYLGTLLARRGKLAEAVPLLERAVQLRPADIDTRLELARALESGQRQSEAAEVLRQGLAQSGDDAHARFLIAAFRGLDAPPVMPPTLVRTLFDGYSENFDEHLEKLQYRAPQYLRASLEAVGARPNLDVLDLGCGTGLCGPLLRPLARTLAGIDLSPAMIRVARNRGVYDRLDVGEIVAVLRDRPAAYDLLVAADVLIYLGEVSGLFAAASLALRSGGLFALSVESSETPGWVLRPSRRYAHHPEYIRQTAGLHGFEPVHQMPIIVRKEASADLAGLVIVLRKSG